MAKIHLLVSRKKSNNPIFTAKCGYQVQGDGSCFTKDESKVTCKRCVPATKVSKEMIKAEEEIAEEFAIDEPEEELEEETPEEEEQEDEETEEEYSWWK